MNEYYKKFELELTDEQISLLKSTIEIQIAHISEVVKTCNKNRAYELGYRHLRTSHNLETILRLLRNKSECQG